MIHNTPLPIEFEIAVIDKRPLTLLRVGQIDGSYLWKVEFEGKCLSKSGEWREDRPRRRSTEFLAACRWKDFNRAVAAARAAATRMLRQQN